MNILESLREFLSDSNNLKFLGGIALILLLIYILKGENGREKFTRLAFLVGGGLLAAFCYYLILVLG